MASSPSIPGVVHCLARGCLTFASRAARTPSKHRPYPRTFDSSLAFSDSPISCNPSSAHSRIIKVTFFCNSPLSAPAISHFVTVPLSLGSNWSKPLTLPLSGTTRNVSSILPVTNFPSAVCPHQSSATPSPGCAASLGSLSKNSMENCRAEARYARTSLPVGTLARLPSRTQSTTSPSLTTIPIR